MSFKVGKRSYTLPIYNHENAKPTRKLPTRENTKIALNISNLASQNTPRVNPWTPPRSPHETSLPSKYEEIRVPFGIQEATHKKILEVGKILRNKDIVELQQEQNNIVANSKDAIWAKANIIKKEAVKEAIQKTRLEFQRSIKESEIKIDFKVKEAVAKATEHMEDAIQDAVAKEREVGEIKCREAVLASEKRWEKKINEAVLKAVKEEKLASQRAIQDIKIRLENETIRKICKLQEEKNNEIDLLKNDYEIQLKASITSVQVQVEAINEIRLKEEQEKFENRLRTVKNELIMERQRLKEEIKYSQNILREKNRIESELKDVYCAFVNFVKCSKPYTNEQVNLIMPRLKTIEYSIDYENDNNKNYTSNT